MDTKANRSTPAWIAGISLVTLGCYWQVHNFQFVYDSVGFVLDNPHIQAFSWANTQWILFHAWLQNWQPVTWLSHTLDFTLFGDHAGSHHLVNLAFHLGNSLLLYFLMRRLFRLGNVALTAADQMAGITAFIFAVHPQHVESVVMISQRKDMLYGLFSLLCTFAYLRRDQATTDRFKWTLVVLGLYLLDLMSKPMAVTLPLVFVALDALLLRKGTTPAALMASVLDKSGMLVLAVLVGVVTLTTQQTAMFPSDLFTPLHRLAHAIHNYGFYSWKFLAPVDLSPYYQFTTLKGMLQLSYWLPSLLYLAAASAFCIVAYRRNRPGFLLGWLYFLLTLAPVCGYLQVGSASAADHYLYLATIPFGALIAWLAVSLVQRQPSSRSVLITTTAAWLLALVLLTWVQVGFWRSPFSLWQRALMLYPNAQLPRRNLAITYMQAGAYDKALAEARKLARPDKPLLEEIQRRQAAENR